MIDEPRIRREKGIGEILSQWSLRNDLQVNLAHRMHVFPKWVDKKCPVRREGHIGQGRGRKGLLSAGIVGSNMSCQSSNRECLEKVLA